MPQTSLDKIANEAILETSLAHTQKLSVVLRESDSLASSHSINSLRKYVGEVYSTLWDCAMGQGELMDVVVYPQNLPNAAPEQWIHILDDLQVVCSHDSICGWMSTEAGGSGVRFQETSGAGGLDAHVNAINVDRTRRGLTPVEALHVDPWPQGATTDFCAANNVMFLDDDAVGWASTPANDDEDVSIFASNSFLGGARIPSSSLFQSVAVGGTFDSMHYGHRKLLTLAVSSVAPITGKLLIGVTLDRMLQHKQFSDLIPTLDQRIQGVKDFVHRLAPGMKNRLRIVAIEDSYGPPGSGDGGDFEALVLSHETLDTGHKLNEHRVQTLGAKPLVLLCTRRTEPYGMSSTALRKLKNLKHEAGVE
jgi:phosphopantetheine adenylyltransferase